jgi:hypothetical protein
MKIKNIVKAVLMISLACTTSSSPFAPTNFFEPTDPALHLPKVKKKKMTIGVFVEGGSRGEGRNWEKHPRNVLQLHDDYQSLSPAFLNPVTFIRGQKEVAANPKLARIYGEEHMKSKFYGDYGLMAQVEYNDKQSQIFAQQNKDLASQHLSSQSSKELDKEISSTKEKIDKISETPIIKILFDENLSKQHENLLKDQISDEYLQKKWFVETQKKYLELSRGHQITDYFMSKQEHYRAPEQQASLGQLKFSGEFSAIETTIFGNYIIPFDSIPGTLWLSWFLPAKSKRIKNVMIEGVGENMKKDLLDDDFQKNMMALSNLDLYPINNSGIGDFTAVVNWGKNFRKDEKYFSDICAFVKVGVSCPTGEAKHEDKMFSMALGHDDHWGIPFGMGVSCEPIEQIKLGINADFMKLLPKTRVRRLKTHENQTEFLLFNKGRAKKSPGFQLQINPFLQIFRFESGLSFKVAYQYTRHNSDKLTLKDEYFESTLKRRRGIGEERVMIEEEREERETEAISDPNALINTANSLKKWEIHNLIFQINWDIAESVKDAPGAPQLSIFYKRPFSGRNIIDSSTFGGQLAFNF